MHIITILKRILWGSGKKSNSPLFKMNRLSNILRDGHYNHMSDRCPVDLPYCYQVPCCR